MIPLIPISVSTPSVTPSTAMLFSSLRSQSWRSATKRTVRFIPASVTARSSA